MKKMPNGKPVAPWFWALIIAPVYFLFWRAWKHAVLALFLNIITFGFSNIAYTFFARHVVENACWGRERLLSEQQNSSEFEEHSEALAQRIRVRARVLLILLTCAICYFVFSYVWGLTAPLLFITWISQSNLISEQELRFVITPEYFVGALLFDIKVSTGSASLFYLTVLGNVPRQVAISIGVIAVVLLFEDRKILSRSQCSPTPQ